MYTFKVIRVFALLLTLSAAEALATSRFVSFDGGGMLLNKTAAVSIHVAGGEQKGVATAAANLSADINNVCGAAVSITGNSDADIIVGTLGHSPAIDKMVREKVLDARMLKGKRETFVITTAGDKLVIAGSDRRGAIYGIYELSRQIGVSPWHYWADVPIERHDRIYIAKGTYTDGEPAVRFRGLFINDEAPCLTSWVKNTFGTSYGDHRFYAKVFELILRLKGNMLWPAMWGWAFYADDPLNSKTADEMGVIIGTSHHEPMARNHQEWARNRKANGAWNYSTNQATIDRFFTEGIERMKGTEDIVTIGMRGDGDEAMSEDTNTKLLEKVVENQRNIIAKATGKPAKKTAQMWALYKEVQDYYDAGMRVPDDVTILLCDDNWGNIRRVPNDKERKHPGGWGIYYHVDYVGAPRNTKWLNVTQTQQMHEQLSLAYDFGIDRIWILNVGDIKPMEYPITLFMDMAWNPKQHSTPTVKEHTRDFFAGILGGRFADEAAAIYNTNCKYMARVTPEMLDMNTYNIESCEWQKVAADYARLEAEALRLFVKLPADRHDTYRQLLLFPVQAMANLYEMYYAQAMNSHLYKANNPAANAWADRVAECFKRDSVLCREYNKDIAGGKWDGMMTQKHIGYTSWSDNFKRDIMPKTSRTDDNRPATGGYVHSPSDGYVAMEAVHFFAGNAPQNTQWTVYPDYGRTLGAVALTPYTAPTADASLTYRFTLPETHPDKITVRVVVKSTLDFLNKGGMVYDVSLDGSTPAEINFNRNLVDRQPHVYSTFYPTVARRVVESKAEFNVSKADMHTITIRPHDPGIVFEKIVVDCGGYQPSYLFMDESPVERR